MSNENPQAETLMDKIRRVSSKKTDTYYDPVYDITFEYKLLHTSQEFHEHMRKVQEIAKKDLVIKDEEGNEIVIGNNEKYIIANVYLRTVKPENMSLDYWIEICVKSFDLITRYSDAISVKNGYISDDRIESMSLNKL